MTDYCPCDSLAGVSGNKVSPLVREGGKDTNVNVRVIVGSQECSLDQDDLQGDRDPTVINDESTCQHGTNFPKARISMVAEELHLTVQQRKIIEKLRDAFQCVLDYSIIHGYRAKGNEELPYFWIESAFKCGWIKFLKYKLAAFVSWYLGCPTPECPYGDDRPHLLCTGRLGRFIRLRSNSQSEENMSFVVGILHLKKGMPRPEMADVYQSMEKTYELLTTAQVVPTSQVVSRENILLETDAVCRELFHGKRFSEAQQYRPFCPSLSANYIATRDDMGMFGAIYEHLNPVAGGQEDIDLSLAPHVRSFEDDDFISNGERKRAVGLDGIVRDIVELKYFEVYDKVSLAASTEEAKVTLVGLPEALKVRTISKGPPFTYFVLKPLQKFLHRIMVKMKCFSLIGYGDVDADLLADVFGEINPSDEWEFHSLDYSSATDMLDPSYSNFVAECIAKYLALSVHFRTLFVKALTGHRIIRPKIHRKLSRLFIEGKIDLSELQRRLDDNMVPQLWGQLMGSVVSFIVLCIANLVVVKMSLEKATGVRSSVKDLKALINGDDGLVHAPRCFLTIWKDIAASIGLIPSIGKVYSHKRYLNINSASFTFDLVNGFRQIDYVNMGLVYGLKRSGVQGRSDACADDQDQRIDNLTIGARHQQLMLRCPARLRLSVHNLFLQKNLKLLESIHVPWFVPERYGGLGLCSIMSDDTIIVEPQMSHCYSGSHHMDFRGRKTGPSWAEISIVDSFVKSQAGFPVEFPVTLRPQVLPLQRIDVRNIWRAFAQLPPNTELSEKDTSTLDLSSFYLYSKSLALSVHDYSSDESAARVCSRLKSNERLWSSAKRRYDAMGISHHPPPRPEGGDLQPSDCLSATIILPGYNVVMIDLD
jgi:hypothetical protein